MSDYTDKEIIDDLQSEVEELQNKLDNIKSYAEEIESLITRILDEI